MDVCIKRTGGGMLIAAEGWDPDVERILVDLSGALAAAGSAMARVRPLLQWETSGRRWRARGFLGAVEDAGYARAAAVLRAAGYRLDAR